MKQKYEPSKIKFILLNTCDIITMSGNETDSIVPDDGSIGGGGYDSGGWT